MSDLTPMDIVSIVSAVVFGFGFLGMLTRHFIEHQKSKRS